jgi:Zn-dependent metalloprotease
LKKTSRVLAVLLAAGLVAVGTPAYAAPRSLPEGLRQIQARQSLLATHTWYQQTYRGIPVFGGYYVTHTAADGTVTVTDGLRQVTGLSGLTAGITAEKARSSVAGRLGGQPKSAELVIVPGATAKLAWLTLTPTGSGTVRSVLDAGTGAVLKEQSIVHDADARGQVFDPNPVVALQDESLTDDNDADSDALAAAYKTVTLTQLDAGATGLQGAYANNISSRPVTSRLHSFVYPRSNRGFEQVMAYYTITTAQNYIHTLGFDDVNNEPQDYSTTGLRADNSFYDPSVDAITFGTGGVDDAEDNEVIWHEYGHAIQDDQVPGFGESEEAGAIGEGFGDYWAATLSQATSPDTATTPWACLMDWDSTFYTTGTPHCIRRTDTAKLYPGDLDGEVHDDGEIWSHALWNINGALGRETANKVILEAQFSFTPDTTMPAAADATVAAADALYGADVAATVHAAFVDRGILA